MSERHLLLSLPLLLTNLTSLIAADHLDMMTTLTVEVILRGGTTI